MASSLPPGEAHRQTWPVDSLSTDRWTPVCLLPTLKTPGPDRDRSSNSRGSVLWRRRSAPGVAARRRDRRVALAEVDLDRVALLSLHLEVLLAVDARDARDDVAGNGLDLGVELAHIRVVVAA